MDQTGVIYVPGHKSSYEKTGARQVSVHGLDEKRTYTLCVSSTAAGDLLPFQQVCGGQSLASIPSDDAPGKGEANKLGFDFTYADGKASRSSHYSTMKTMVDVCSILTSFFILPHLFCSA
jgi:hypothetical protein